MSIFVNGEWVPTPLFRYHDETLLRNPVNGATYVTAADALNAVGQYSVEVRPNPLTINTNGTVQTPPIIAEDGAFLGGLLDGEIFGISKKLVAVGVVAWLVLGGKK